MNAHIVLGNQLFNPQILLRKVDPKTAIIFMREDRELCTYYKFHKHKIIFFLAAMRTYAEELRELGFKVHYEQIDTQSQHSYEQSLQDFFKKNQIQSVSYYEIEDKFFESRIQNCLDNLKIDKSVYRSAMFVTSREDFTEYLNSGKKPFMKTFYEKQRKKFQVLVDSDLNPVGGRWSFDDENRLALEKDHFPPDVFLKILTENKHITDVQTLTEKNFPDHPGDVSDFRFPVDRKQAHLWLDKFLNERLEKFGPYEDAIPAHSDFLYHSLLTPFLNIGLLTPQTIVLKTLEIAKAKKTPLPSLEGFIRQVIGWREFVRGIYQNYSEQQEGTNFFKHHKKLKQCWYDGNTGVTPLDNVIRKANKYGFAHHIDRLMVVGSRCYCLRLNPRKPINGLWRCL